MASMNNLVCVSFGMMVIAVTNAGKSGDGAPHWSYHGAYSAENWGTLFGLCKADSPRQSPINIPTPDTFYDESLDPVSLLISRYDVGAKYTMTNNGHSVNIAIPGDVYVEGGNLGDVYKMAGIHFHWGSASAIGSEHTVNMKHYPLEMHMVNYDAERHDTIATAVDGDNSLAVLGTLFEISEEDNPAFDPIIEQLANTEFPDDTATLASLDLPSLLPKNKKDYYRYEGSLTTPPCFESVVWTVFSTTQKISENQLKKFRNLKESADTDLTIIDNWRPVQDIQRRKVFRSFRTQQEVAANYETRQVSGPSSGSPAVSSHLMLPSLFTISAICIKIFSK